MPSLFRPLLFLLGVTAAPLLMAGGAIQGAVSDAVTQQPVAGVVVSVAAAELGGSRTATTGEDGGYRFADLPEGTYAVETEAAGYKPFGRGELRLRGDRTLRVNLPLLPKE